MKHIVIIPAAGIGSRFKSLRPKQYQSLLNKTVLQHAIDSFAPRDDVAAIIVAVAADDPFIKTLTLPTKVNLVTGGAERSDSVYCSLNSLQNISDDTLIAVHDAARPCVSQADIDAVFGAAKNNIGGALLALESHNTLKQKSANQLITLDRSDIYAALTPQVFGYGVLKKALDKVRDEALAITDDASAVELLGLSPELVIGSNENIKITQPGDLALAKFYLEQR